MSYCHVDDIAEGAGVGFASAGARLFAIRWRGKIYLYRNQCPHQGTTLDWNPNTFFDCEGEYLQCSTHGALFQPDTGYCVEGPCVGAHLQSLPFRICDGRLLPGESDTRG